MNKTIRTALVFLVGVALFFAGTLVQLTSPAYATLSDVELVSSTNTIVGLSGPQPNSFTIRNCPAGKDMLTGGYGLAPSDVSEFTVFSSRPDDFLRGWRVDYIPPNTNQSVELTIWVLCGVFS